MFDGNLDEYKLVRMIYEMRPNSVLDLKRRVIPQLLHKMLSNCYLEYKDNLIKVYRVKDPKAFKREFGHLYYTPKMFSTAEWGKSMFIVFHPEDFTVEESRMSNRDYFPILYDYAKKYFTAYKPKLTSDMKVVLKYHRPAIAVLPRDLQKLINVDYVDDLLKLRKDEILKIPPDRLTNLLKAFRTYVNVLKDLPYERRIEVLKSIPLDDVTLF